MAERRPSLLDDQTSSVGMPKAKAAKGPGKSQGIKLGLAVLLFAAAGVIFAWSQGWILAPAPEPIPEPTPEERQAAEQQRIRNEQAIRENKAIQSGSE